MSLHIQCWEEIEVHWWQLPQVALKAIRKVGLRRFVAMQRQPSRARESQPEEAK